MEWKDAFSYYEKKKDRQNETPESSFYKDWTDQEKICGDQTNVEQYVCHVQNMVDFLQDICDEKFIDQNG